MIANEGRVRMQVIFRPDTSSVELCIEDNEGEYSQVLGFTCSEDIDLILDAFSRAKKAMECYRRLEGSVAVAEAERIVGAK